ncbi:hypothetical protein [Aequorivita ciconiae]|uniref:hypothetical protein n=1 Tax=Aequorivita ciconiae TaxID=2494375 RepID=UPI0013E31128|nr:hypothetical protein [Aequorivita sp. H23M31]
MTNLAIPLADWGMGTTLIIIFALVCIVLTVIVLSFIFGGKKKDSDKMTSTDEETF